MNCWVLGASGKVGQALCTRLALAGHSVVGIGRQGPPLGFSQAWFQWDPTIQADRPSSLPEADTVFFLAGQTSAYVAREDVALDIQANLVSLARVVAEASRDGVRPHIITAGAATEAPLDGVGLAYFGTTAATVSFYETAKAAQRLYLAQFARDGLIDFTTLRLANVYGGPASTTRDRGFLDQSILRALEGNPVYYFDDGAYERDYIFIDDVASAFISASMHRDQTNNQVFDIGTGVATPIRGVLEGLARIILHKTGRRVELIAKTPPATLHPVDSGNRTVDSSRFTARTGWHAEVDLESGLERAVDIRLGRQGVTV